MSRENHDSFENLVKFWVNLGECAKFQFYHLKMEINISSNCLKIILKTK